MNIGQRIKKQRLTLHMTREELASKLDVSVGAISNYENGISIPKTEILVRLFSVLNCDANYLYQDMIPQSIHFFTQEEQLLIHQYRKLSSSGRSFVQTVIEHELQNEAESEHAKEFIALAPPKLIDHFPALASAGTGQFLFDDIPASKIEIDDSIDADFAIDVNGSSMEPTYYDGDTLLVKKQASIHQGEIGIFLLDGESYVKEYQTDRLISHNKKYPDLLFQDFQDIRCIGKVMSFIK